MSMICRRFGDRSLPDRNHHGMRNTTASPATQHLFQSNPEVFVKVGIHEGVEARIEETQNHGREVDTFVHVRENIQDLDGEIRRPAHKQKTEDDCKKFQSFERISRGSPWGQGLRCT